MEDIDWIDLTENRDRRRALINAVMNLRAPQNPGNTLTIWETVSFSGKTLLHLFIKRPIDRDPEIQHASCLAIHQPWFDIRSLSEWQHCFLKSRCLFSTYNAHGKLQWIGNPPVNLFRPRTVEFQCLLMVFHNDITEADSTAELYRLNTSINAWERVWFSLFLNVHWITT